MSLMFPSEDAASRPIEVPPPPRFKPIVGSVQVAHYTALPLKPPVGDTAARKAGLRYEEKVQTYLSSTFPGSYKPSPQISFKDMGGWRTCVPDGILVGQGIEPIFVFEVKSQHMPEAWWQLRRLYEPVLRVMYRTRPIVCVEVVRSFDPSMPFPERFTRVEKLLNFIADASGGEFGVHRWRT